MRHVEFYSLNLIRETKYAITIICTKNRIPLLSELLKHKKEVFKVVYILENENNCEIRMENINWR